MSNRKNTVTADLDYQKELLQRGTNYVKLLRAATTGKGITKLDSKGAKRATKLFEDQGAGYELLHFIPASGAASRMFKRVRQWLADPKTYRSEIKGFFKRAEELPFFDEWLEKANEKDLVTFESGLEAKVEWLRLLISPDGLNLAAKPKAVIPFHRYEKDSATALEEHLIMAKEVSPSKPCRVHFTVAKDAWPVFEDALKKIFEKGELQAEDFSIEHSEQPDWTNTIALDNDGNVVCEGGEPIMRPGGHGSLIHNLNDIQAELIFIRNIDNVCRREVLPEVSNARKMLAGTLIELRNDLSALYEQMGKGLVDETSIEEVRTKWGVRIPKDYTKLSQFLKRPIRVCGMVKNEGEPGGGPFWCLDKFTGESLQIIEQSQVNVKDMRQSMILKSSTHFNPVDLVCCVVNFEGQHINLLDFVDSDQYFVSDKTHGEIEIKALEWPGLWNGSMANWITLFVEIPSVAFSPVKEITDLLKANHSLSTAL
ncbi:MAG: hypothetical protein Kow0075_06840 [Salibacteraceae bacterium]